MKITPPRSRRRCTQPMISAREPAPEARSCPQVWVRFRWPRKSSGTLDCISVFALLDPHRNFRCADVFLYAGLHVLQRILARGDFVIADDQGIPRAELVGQLHRP